MTANTLNHRAILALAGKRPFLFALAGTLMLWCAFPPIGFWPIAWVALVPWIWLVAVKEFEAGRPLLKIWCAGLIYWAASNYFIPIPHPALWLGWVALSLYLSVYPLLFIWLSRIMVHDHRVPLPIAAAVVFTALEWVRAHAISGFGLLMLANSQYQMPIVLQICDLFGAYGLTFVIVLCNGCLANISIARRRVYSLAVLILLVLGTVGYGVLRLSHDQLADNDDRRHGNITIIQGSIDTRFPKSEEEIEEYRHEFVFHYFELQHGLYSLLGDASHSTKSAALSIGKVILWPEGKYPIPHYVPGSTSEDAQFSIQEFPEFHKQLFATPFEWLTPPKMIVGGATIDEVNDAEFNSAFLLDSDGKIIDQYHKNHRVIFGEYVPLEHWFPVLGRITPIGRGLTAGTEPASFDVGGYRLSPSICFESTVTHLIRGQINELASLGKEPQALLNLTDDGWFYGTALLDHHLACNVIRAVEMRKPVLVAANTGLSANISGSGVIMRQGPRRKPALMTGIEFYEDQRISLYRTVGDWPAVALVAICVVAILTRNRRRKSN